MLVENYSNSRQVGSVALLAIFIRPSGQQKFFLYLSWDACAGGFSPLQIQTSQMRRENSNFCALVLALFHVILTRRVFVQLLKIFPAFFLGVLSQPIDDWPISLLSMKQ